MGLEWLQVYHPLNQVPRKQNWTGRVPGRAGRTPRDTRDSLTIVSRADAGREAERFGRAMVRDADLSQVTIPVYDGVDACQ